VLATYLRRRRGDHTVLVLSSGPCGPFFRRTGARVVDLPVLDGQQGVTRRLGPRNALSAAAVAGRSACAIRTALAGSGESVVVTNSMKSHLLVPPLGRSLRLRVGIRLHDILSPDASSRIARRMFAAASRLAASTACVSDAAASSARSLGARDVVSFPNGVEVGPPPTHHRNGSLALVAICSLTPGKGLDVALEALAIARGRGVAVTLDVVGGRSSVSPGHDDALRRRAAWLGLEGAVRWHGRIDPRPFLARSDALLHLPIADDALPTVALEAFGQGVPVIGTRIGGLPEIVTHGVDGFLVRPGDAAAAARAIEQLTTPEVRQRLSGCAQATAGGRYSIESYESNFDRWLAALEVSPAW
jgi:glycosyltransferase involved in cell wall biosynthesis